MGIRWSEEDHRYMRRALALARRGYPAPNPYVGAVVVRDNRIVGEGYHRYVGEGHAEVMALERAGRSAEGATLYVNLEPCCHHGRTPPCTDAILLARIARVVVAAEDPDPRVGGGGIRLLRERSVKVEVGLCAEEALRLNRMHYRYHATGRPWVTVKAAVSLDGKIATATGESKWITDEPARKRAHRLRAEHAAILIGARTALLDSPRLTVRLRGVKTRPLRVILDPEASLPAASTVFDTEAPTLVFHRFGRLQANSHIPDPGVQVEHVSGAKDRLDLVEVSEKLAERGITSVLVEGGGELIASFLEARLVDRVCFFFAPLLIGGASAPTAYEGQGVSALAKAIRVGEFTLQKVGGGWMVDGVPMYPEG